MELYWPYVIKTFAVLVAAGHGWFLATVPADWHQDQWGVPQDGVIAHRLGKLDPTGMVGGLMPLWTGTLAAIRSSCILYGALNTLAPVVGLTLAIFGWPLSEHIFKEDYGLLLIGLEPSIWVVVGSTSVGYLVGRLFHKGFFKGRNF